MRPKGIALITVLSALAVVSVISTTLLSWQHAALQHTTKLLQSSQGMDYLYAMEDWAEAVLLRDLKQGSIDSLDESWALHLAPVAVDRGFITGQLHDMQGRFNLNNLIAKGKYQPAEGERLKRLMQTLGLEDDVATEVTNALRDWIDQDQSENFPGGAEDYYYLNLSPPYRAADRPLVSPTELLLVKGVTRDVWQTLSPHVTVLPGYRPVNVNTATKAVLQSLSSDIDATLAEDILDHRLDTPFTSVAKFIEFRRNRHAKGVKLPEIKPNSIAVASHFFLLNGSVDVDTRQMHEQALIHRDGQGAGVIRRSFGMSL